MNAYIRSINKQAVCELASRFNNDVPCRIVGSSHGSFNFCFFVEFDAKDGKEPTKWVVRLPMGPALESAWDKAVSEVATIRYIEQKTSIPVPHVYAYGRDSSLIIPDKAISMDGDQIFILTDFMAGNTLKKQELATADPKHRRSFFLQLAAMLAELRKLEFSQLGSPMPGETDETPVFGPILAMSDNVLHLTPQPVQTATGYMKHEFDVVCEFFVPPVSTVDVDDLREELYALHALEPQFPGLIDPALDKDPFVFCHLDLQAHNILVDEKFHIQGVIDWEFAGTIPLQLFTPPSWVTGHDASTTGSVLHDAFREALHSLALADPSYRQLQSEWYGGEMADPLSPETTRKFCIAHIVRMPSDAVNTFYEFMKGEATEEEKAAKLTRFFKDHPTLEAKAQKRRERAQAYVAYLTEHGLFETRADRIRHMEKELRAKLGLPGDSC